jgi:hypothetical protein
VHHAEVQTKWGKFHRYFGWFMVIAGLATASSGLAAYQDYYNPHREDILWPLLNTFFFMFLILGSEVVFQVWSRCSKRQVSVNKGHKSFSLEDFKYEVFDQNRKLVLLDNKVLELGQFPKFHPGGFFTLEKNVGRDVTKFFNGAYKLVASNTKEIQWNHSARALSIANSMIIG